MASPYASLTTLIELYKKDKIPSRLYESGIDNISQFEHLDLSKSIGISESSIPHMDTKKLMRHKAFVEYLSNFKNVFEPGAEFLIESGFLNFSSIMIENYAVSMEIDGKYAVAKEVFDVLTSSGLELHKMKREHGKVMSPVANRRGFLGFEGVLQYANACLDSATHENANKDVNFKKAENLYLLLAELPSDCQGGSRLNDAKIEAIGVLVSVYNQKHLDYLLRVENSRRKLNIANLKHENGVF